MLTLTVLRDSRAHGIGRHRPSTLTLTLTFTLTVGSREASGGGTPQAPK
jgi:hypothetical protein